MKQQLFSVLRKSALILGFAGLVGKAEAQVSITSLTPYSQNFDGLPTAASTWGNDQTLLNWHSTRTGIIKVNDGSITTTGLYNFGSTNALDRALGSAGAGTSTSYGVLLQNNTNNNITSLTIQYAAELYHAGNGNKTVGFNFDYKLNETSLSATGYAAVIAGANYLSTGGASPSTRNVLTFVLSGINLAPTNKIMLRWTDNTLSDFNLGLDDVTITPGSSSVSTTVYYSKPNPNKNNVYFMNDPASWGTNTNGTGTQPGATFSNGVFIVSNRTTSTLSSDWILGSNSKVIVNEGTFIIPTNFSLTGTIDVADNAILTIENSAMPALGVLGNLSTVNYNSTSTVTLPDAEYANLSINNGNKKLSVETRIKKNLNINNSKLELDNNDLWLDEGATITGANSTGFISTKGNGRLKMKVKAGGAEVVFPVGTDVYLPVRIKQASGKTDDVFSVKVFDGVYDNYTNNAPAIGSKLFASKAVAKTWIVDEEVAGGSDITLTLGWASTDVLTGFNDNNVRIGHYHNGAWDDYSGAQATLVNGIYEISRPGITSFSPMGAFGDTPGALPVELVNFKAQRQNQAVECEWQTAQEINNDNFVVERSMDGKQFAEIGKVKGAGNTRQFTTYRFTDSKAPESLIYYRLRQTDFDGTTSYSKIVAVQKSSTRNTLAVDLYPNPANGMRYLRSVSAVSGPAEITIINALGKLISKQLAEAAQLENGMLLDMKGKPNGLYFITIRTSNEVLTLRAIQQ